MNVATLLLLRWMVICSANRDDTDRPADGHDIGDKLLPMAVNYVFNLWYCGFATLQQILLNHMWTEINYILLMNSGCSKYVELKEIGRKSDINLPPLVRLINSVKYERTESKCLSCGWNKYWQNAIVYNFSRVRSSRGKTPTDSLHEESSAWARKRISLQ